MSIIVTLDTWEVEWYTDCDSAIAQGVTGTIDLHLLADDLDSDDQLVFVREWLRNTPDEEVQEEVASHLGDALSSDERDELTSLRAFRDAILGAAKAVADANAG
jgi:hypothetical protein